MLRLTERIENLLKLELQSWKEDVDTWLLSLENLVADIENGNGPFKKQCIHLGQGVCEEFK